MRNYRDIVREIISEHTRELLREVEDTLPRTLLQKRVLDLRLAVDRGIEELREHAQ
jgi:hypothetical protein